MANKYFKQFMYTPHVYPVILDFNFVVDSTNGNGLGIRSLKGNGIANVFMNTSAAFTGTSHTSTLIDGIASGTSSLLVGMEVQGSGIPAGTTIASIVSSSSITLSAATSSSTTGSITYQAPGNPNPAAGEIIVQLSDNYAGFLGAWGGFNSPLAAGGGSTSTTANVINVVTVLGTATLAQWQTVGWPLGLPIPTLGAAFVATSSALIGGSAKVTLRNSTGAGIDHIETVGDPNQTLVNLAIQNAAQQQNTGGYVYMACFSDTVLTPPANNSVIGLEFYLSNHKGGLGNAT